MTNIRKPSLSLNNDGDIEPLLTDETDDSQFVSDGISDSSIDTFFTFHNYRVKAAKIRKIVAWDFDGVINNVVQYVYHPIDPKIKHFAFQAKLHSQNTVGMRDVVIDNAEFLQLTLDILRDNGVHSVCGAQRLVDSKAEHSSYLDKEIMFTALKSLAISRDFNSENLLQGKKLDIDKIAILNLYHDKFKMLHLQNPHQFVEFKSSDIVLIDDALKFKESTEAAGYQFVHVQRNRGDLYQDTMHLCEVLTRTVSIENIYESMRVLLKQELVGKKTLDVFKQHLLRYQLDNLEQVAAYQKKCAPANSEELQAKNILIGLRNVILSTDWELGLTGGEGIYHRGSGAAFSDRYVNQVPKNMLDIIKIIGKAHAVFTARGRARMIQPPEYSWQEGLQRVKQKAAQALEQGSHHFWNRRSVRTGLFYQMLAQRVENAVVKVEEKKPEAVITPKL